MATHLTSDVSAGQPADGAIACAQHTLHASQVRRIGGFVGQRYQMNIAGSIKGFDIDRYVAMLERPGHRDWWWIGEQPGKWLESALLASTMSGDADLLTAAKAVTRRLSAAQSADGYLGITDPAVRTAAKPLRGMDAYEQYFTLHALLSAYEITSDADAIAAAVRLGDYYLNHIGPGKAEFWPSPLRPPANRNTIICRQYTWVPAETPQAPELYWQSEIAGHTAHSGWEGTLIIDPILRLYQVTGQRRFLEFAKWVISRIDTWSGWDAFSRLEDVAAGKAGVHELQPYVHAHTFQMNFLGFLRLYQVTADRSLLKKVEGAWRDIAARQLYVTGGVSVGEHYEPGYHRPLTGHVVETCANMSWMQLTQHLLQLTGNPIYADVIERLLFNHVFASQTCDGDSYRYHTPPNGLKPAQYFHGPDCCTSSGHRLVSMLPLFVYAQATDAAIVNQYVSSVATFQLGPGREMQLTQQTAYPESDQIVLQVRVNAPVETAIRLRIPAWCAQPSIAVNGAHLSGVRPGAYYDLRRMWQSGDNVTLHLPMHPRWVQHDHLPDDAPRFAVERGPVVYAADTLWWDDPSMPRPFQVDRSLALPRDKWPELRQAATPEGCLGPAYRAELSRIDGGTASVLLLPFANVGRWYVNPSHKPDRDSCTWSYAIWLARLGHATDADLRQQAALEQAWAELEQSSLDLVRIGDSISEQAHALAGQDTHVGEAHGRWYRGGRDFSWLMKISTQSSTDLVLTYCADGEQGFDILVNGAVLATESLAAGRPDKFREVRHRLPSALVAGKTDALGQKVDSLIIGFRAVEGRTGRIFGIRTETSRS